MKFRIKNRKNLRSTKKLILWGNQKKKRVKSVKLTNPSKTKKKEREKTNYYHRNEMGYHYRPCRHQKAKKEIIPTSPSRPNSDI